jgi:hypothetical protein
MARSYAERDLDTFGGIMDECFIFVFFREAAPCTFPDSSGPVWPDEDSAGCWRVLRIEEIPKPSYTDGLGAVPPNYTWSEIKLLWPPG